jgi:hypothetical protein
MDDQQGFHAKYRFADFEQCGRDRNRIDSHTQGLHPDCLYARARIVLGLMETRSIKELDACRPLSLDERDLRLDWLAEIRRKLHANKRIFIQIGEDENDRLLFDLALPPYRDDAEEVLENLAKLLLVAEFAEPWQGWLTIEPEELVVQSPSDLARLLKLILTRSGLSPGQLSVKTGIHRSQLYLLTNAARGSLPRGSHQLRRFLKACRVPSELSDVVIERWNELHRNRGR